MKVTPGNAEVDASDGNAKSIDFKVNITGTADHDWTYEIHNAMAAGTEIADVTKDGFRLNVSGREPTGAIRIIVTSAQDPTKSNFITVAVTGVHRVDKIALNYNIDVFYVDASRTPK